MPYYYLFVDDRLLKEKGHPHYDVSEWHNDSREYWKPYLSLFQYTRIKKEGGRKMNTSGQIIKKCFIAWVFICHSLQDITKGEKFHTRNYLIVFTTVCQNYYKWFHIVGLFVKWYTNDN